MSQEHIRRLGIPVVRGTPCFVATVALGSPGAPEVAALREWRDRSLLMSRHGRLLVRLYSGIGPHLAMIVSSSSLLARVARLLLGWLARHVQKERR
jgi:hypothetical protein